MSLTIETIVRLFEENNAKLDAKLDAKFEENNAKLDAKFEENNAKLDAKFEENNAKLDAKFDELTRRLVGPESDFGRLKRSVDAIEFFPTPYGQAEDVSFSNRIPFGFQADPS
jgi:hypothetical protein